MKKLWIWLGLVVVGIAAALFFGRSRVQTGSMDRPWPLGLGVAANAPKHFPATKNNAAATKLIELAKKAEVDLRAPRGRRGGVSEDLREALGQYAQVQLERSGDSIDAPPSTVAQYLTSNAAPLDEIRALALGGTPIVFEADPAHDFTKERLGPNLFALQQLQRTFVIRALDAARGGSAEAWDELHAAWELTRPLFGRPDPEGVLAGMTAARMINAAARKMPLPPPAWFREVSTFDYERAYVAAQQAQAWRNKQPALNERLRGMAEEVLRAKTCDATSPQFKAVREKLGGRATPSLVSGWERLMRFRAEREATERVLQIRAGQTPSPDSQCSDGRWEVSGKSFRFTRNVRSEYPAYDYPLAYEPAAPAQSPSSPPAAPASGRR